MASDDQADDVRGWRQSLSFSLSMRSNPSKRLSLTRVTRVPSPSPTCEESAHYPVFNPRDPRHNPEGPTSSWLNDDYCLSQPPDGASSVRWARGLPKRSIRKARSRFGAFRYGRSFFGARQEGRSLRWSSGSGEGSSGHEDDALSTVSDASTEEDYDFGTDLYRTSCHYSSSSSTYMDMDRYILGLSMSLTPSEYDTPPAEPTDVPYVCPARLAAGGGIEGIPYDIVEETETETSSDSSDSGANFHRLNRIISEHENAHHDNPNGSSACGVSTNSGMVNGDFGRFRFVNENEQLRRANSSVNSQPDNAHRDGSHRLSVHSLSTRPSVIVNGDLRRANSEANGDRAPHIQSYIHSASTRPTVTVNGDLRRANSTGNADRPTHPHGVSTGPSETVDEDVRRRRNSIIDLPHDLFAIINIERSLEDRGLSPAGREARMRALRRLRNTQYRPPASWGVGDYFGFDPSNNLVEEISLPDRTRRPRSTSPPVNTPACSRTESEEARGQSQARPHAASGLTNGERPIPQNSDDTQPLNSRDSDAIEIDFNYSEAERFLEQSTSGWRESASTNPQGPNVNESEDIVSLVSLPLPLQDEYFYIDGKSGDLHPDRGESPVKAEQRLVGDGHSYRSPGRERSASVRSQDIPEIRGPGRPVEPAPQPRERDGSDSSDEYLATYPVWQQYYLSGP